MKKRILSLLATILLFSLLLCSCAEGLPLSELALTARDKATLFSTRVEYLLKESVPLAASGKTDFALVYDRAAPREVQAAIAAFCTQLKSFSGADLLQNDPTSAKRRVLIGIAENDAAKEILRTLSASSFYIGFSGEDLLILAQNDVMLCAALTYFCNTYLNPDATKSDARDIFLPKDLAYIAPTLLCEDDTYTLLRAEKSGEGTVAAMSLLCDTLRERCGVRPVRKTDYNYSGSEHEILLGRPNHPKAKAIWQTLPRDGYYIGVEGKTLMILAQNDLMLHRAVSHFLSLFVTTESAALDKPNKSIEFPSACDYYYTEQSILLAEDGINRTVLVYPANAGQLTRAAVSSFCSLYKQLTNTVLPAYADSKYEREEGVFEILVGRTARRESQKLYFDGIDKGAWRMAVDAGGEALAIGANGEFALKAAVESLGNALTAQTAALSPESIYEQWWIKGGVDRLLYLFPDFAQNGAVPPDLIGAFSYKLYSYSYVMQQTDIGVPRYEEYCAVLKNAGFTCTSQTHLDDVYSSVYLSDTHMVVVTCDKAARTLRAQVSARRERAA